MKIDMQELERQRSERIKKSGKYLEFSVLISSDENSEDCAMPVMTTEMRYCGPEEIARLYVALKAELKELEKEYPIECIFADSCVKIKKICSTEHDLKEGER